MYAKDLSAEYFNAVRSGGKVMVLEGSYDDFCVNEVEPWLRSCPLREQWQYGCGERLVVICVPADQYAQAVEQLVEHLPGLYVANVEPTDGKNIPRIIEGCNYERIKAARENPAGINVPLGTYRPPYPARQVDS